MFLFSTGQQEDESVCKPPDKVVAKVIDMVKKELFRSEKIKYYLDPILQLIIDKIKPYFIVLMIILLLLISGQIYAIWKLLKLNLNDT